MCSCSFSQLIIFHHEPNQMLVILVVISNKTHRMRLSYFPSACNTIFTSLVKHMNKIYDAINHEIDRTNVTDINASFPIFREKKNRNSDTENTLLWVRFIWILHFKIVSIDFRFVIFDNTRGNSKPQAFFTRRKIDRWKLIFSSRFVLCENLIKIS